LLYRQSKSEISSGSWRQGKRCSGTKYRQSAKLGTDRPAGDEMPYGRQRKVGNAPLGRSGNSESPEVSEPVPAHRRIAPWCQTVAEMRAKTSKLELNTIHRHNRVLSVD